jgi:pimeloyl-ACP methyl ester carboxylesterase
MISQTRRICVISLASIWCLTIISGSFLSVNAQQPDSKRLPILLIHGYAEDSGIWNLWRGWLGADHFSKVYPITFLSDDQCGSVEQHATELKNIVDGILSGTPYKKVNIVAHSKGGLDARWYITNNRIDKVASLIMIGTPNAGTTAAFLDLTRCPIGSDSDLFPGSFATQVVDRPQLTHYYTIAGNWEPGNICPSFLPPGWYLDGGNCLILGEDDSLVPVNSVESSSNYISLGEYPYTHVELLQHKKVYERAFPILDRQLDQ